MTQKFAVTYTIDYQHRVVVGVTALSPDNAIQIASNAFDQCTIWDDTADMPLLFDDYEEMDGETLKFSVEKVQEFPKPDSSVLDIKSREFAFSCVKALLTGEITAALEFALKVLPNMHRLDDDIIWSVKSDNGCDGFEVTDNSYADAARDALFALGWSVVKK